MQPRHREPLPWAPDRLAGGTWPPGSGWQPRPRWHRPTRPRAPAWLVLLVLVPMVAGSFGAGHAQPDRHGLDAAGVALLVVAAAGLPVRRRWPVRVLVLAAAATTAYYALGYPVGPSTIALFVAAVTALLTGHRTATFAVLLGALPVLVPLDRALGRPDLSWQEIFAEAAWLLVALAVTEAIRSRRERFAEMARTQEEADRRQAGEERLRIARELHDVLAHNVSLINVQAGTALHLFETEPERARTALAAIKAASHETLQELRATVGALRGTDESAPRAPTAGLSRLDELVAQCAAVGLRVDVRREGAVRQASPSTDLAAFRIVQEALTNVRRHSGADAASVLLSYEDRTLRVAVTDRGRGPGGADLGSGHGVRGMRERAEALGGRLSAGAGPGGAGFAVRAVLPLAHAPAAEPVDGPTHQPAGTS